MSQGPDLFVVCSQCGSEVSPYVTECPYCGHRLRKRAPNIPREHVPSRVPRGLGGRLRTGRSRKTDVASERARPRRTHTRTGLLSGTDTARPWATMGLVAASAIVWIVWHARPITFFELIVSGSLHGEWWRLLTAEFIYGNGIYAFVVLLTVAIFGWLVERRDGPAVVLALFLGAGAAGILVSSAVYSEPTIGGAGGSALALLAVWAMPDVLALRARDYYEGDLLGAGALAVLVLASSFVLDAATGFAAIVGLVIGLALGVGLARVGEPA
jgi:membrane associated rhomboid family serine protease